MTGASVTKRGRSLAERLMVDTVSIDRPGPINDLTGLPTWTTVYLGAGKVSTYQAQEANPSAGGHVFTEQRYRVDVPVGSCSPAVGDVVTVTVCPLDPGLVGRKYRVAALLHKTYATAQRLGVEEVVA